MAAVKSLLPDDFASLEDLGPEWSEARVAEPPPLTDDELAPIEEPDDIDPMAQAEYQRARTNRSSSLTRLLTLDEIAAMPPPEWLLHGVMLDQSVTVLYGPPGALKSFVALDWALSVASGYSWLGTHRVLGGGVVYAAGEGVAGMRQRVAAWQLHNTAARSPADNFRLLPASLRLLEPAGIDRVIEAINAEPFTPRLLVIDTWGRALAGADENSTSDVSQAVGAIDAIREATGVSVLAVHHSRADGERERGNSALRGAADQMIKASRDGQGPVTLYSEKIKDGVPFSPMTLEPVEVGGSLVLRSAAGPRYTATPTQPAGHRGGTFF
jgi:hypothetical protein